MNYYNENDPHAAAWLKALIAEGLIPKGFVDERSIREVGPADLAGFTQCHFFAGIGGWPLALRLAGWPDDQSVWTGSCPCQPFSDAGKKKGAKDERHLWPAWFPLIRKLNPSVVFGEQVASKAALGWLDGVFADLEGADYACAAADLCAASVGAPHIRQRLFWVADSKSDRRHTGPMLHQDAEAGNPWAGDRSGPRRMADAASHGGSEQLGESGKGSRRPTGPSDSAECGGPSGLGNPSRNEQRRDSMSGINRERFEVGGSGGAGGVVHANNTSKERLESDRLPVEPKQETTGCGLSDPWQNFDLIRCADGKARRVESGTFPLAYGIPARVVRLRGYGNAIVPEAAARFIQAAEEARRLARSPLALSPCS